MAQNNQTKEEMEEARQKRLATLKASYQMYENSKVDTKEKHKNAKDKSGNRIYSESATKQTIQLMETMQQDVYDEYVQLGGNPEDLKTKSNKKKGVDRRVLEDLMKKETMKDEMAAYIKQMNDKSSKDNDDNSENDNEQETAIYNTDETSELDKYSGNSIELHESQKMNVFESHDNTEDASKKKMYDVVKLPSKGIAYKNKKSKLKVAYLTAYDENMILSPGLYEDGTFLDKILEQKILDDFNPQDLLPGDRDAIVIWLRATGYGNEYPLNVTDPQTKEEFETTFDLSNIKYKDFNLVADENGYFDFKLPVTKDLIKFKFLTVADHKFLKDLRIKDEKRVAVSEARRAIEKIDKVIIDYDTLESSVVEKLSKLSDEAYKEIVEKYDPKDDKTFSRALTNSLTLMIVSINGIKDRKYISDYVMNMNVRDAAELRKYVSNNEPGIDYNIKVERPASLGGGSIETFLQLSEFIFVTFPK